MTQTILILTGAYALVAVMLALLLIVARLPLTLKIGATLATAALVPLTLHAIEDLRGIPSESALPPFFKLHWARVVDPNPLRNEPGSVFLWVEELDAENYPSGLPRAYRLAYDPALVNKVEVAMGKIAAGEEVAGSISDVPTAEQPTGEELAEEVAELGAPVDGRMAGNGVGERITDFDAANLTFGEQEAPVTPEKPD